MVFKSFNCFYGTFQAFEEGKYQCIGNTIMNTTTLLFILISIYTDMGILEISFSYLLANLITIIYVYYILNITYC